MRNVKIRIVGAGTLIAAVALSSSAPALDSEEAARPAGRLTVRVEGLRSGKGALAFALYDSEQAFAERAEPVRSGFVPVDDKRIEFDLDALPPGSYAAAFYHDRNGNGQLDRRALGIPSEPYGFSNDARGRFGPPGFEEARFELDGEPSLLEVRVK